MRSPLPRCAIAHGLLRENQPPQSRLIVVMLGFCDDKTVDGLAVPVAAAPQSAGSCNRAAKLELSAYKSRDSHEQNVAPLVAAADPYALLARSQRKLAICRGAVVQSPFASYLSQN